MLLALVLAACIAPAAHEWVEISQQHYRKPSHTHVYPTGGTFYPADEEIRPDYEHYPILDKHDHKRPIYEVKPMEENIPDIVYENHTIAEHNWNYDRGGNIKRVDENIKIRPNVTPVFSLEIYGQVTEIEPDQVTGDYGDRLKDKKVFSARPTIERVPNKGSVKRVQLSNTPVKSPSVTNALSSIRRNDIRPHGSPVPDNDFSDEFEIKADIYKNAQEDSVTSINRVMNLFSSTNETPVRNYDRMGISTTEPGIIFQKYPQMHAHISNVTNISTVGGNRASNEHTNSVVKTKLAESFKEPAPKFTTIKPKDIYLEGLTTNSATKNSMNPNNIVNQKLQSKDPKTTSKPNIDTSSKDDVNVRKKEIKENTMENIMKFVKVVADTISKNTKRGVNGKVKYLNELKDTLLSSIKARIEATWPDDSSRAARSARSPRGHVEFPSSESSLMTISFLTFAVFLIKLVLQVIHTYKNKTMMVAPLMVATAGRALPKLRGSH